MNTFDKKWEEIQTRYSKRIGESANLYTSDGDTLAIEHDAWFYLGEAIKEAYLLGQQHSIERVRAQAEELRQSNLKHIKETKLTGVKKDQWLWFNLGLMEIRDFATTLTEELTGKEV